MMKFKWKEGRKERRKKKYLTLSWWKVCLAIIKVVKANERERKWGIKEDTLFLATIILQVAAQSSTRRNCENSILC